LFTLELYLMAQASSHPPCTPPPLSSPVHVTWYFRVPPSRHVTFPRRGSSRTRK
jgi:hypothetical protein